MRLYVNRKAVRGPWGGENSFMGALCRYLETRGWTITIDREAPADLALLNALTQIDLDFVRRLHDRGLPIVHRKVGFVVSGPPELRAVRDGVVEGDRRQIAFSPHLVHTVFQSAYSRDLFHREGFEGPHSVVHNGVDEAKFNLEHARWFGLSRRPRAYWRPGEPFRVLAVSWSKDPAKGFALLQDIDRALDGRSDVTVRFVGNRPDDVSFENIPCLPAQPHRRLAELYRTHHALLFLGREETCSNTILEGINCGMAVIFHPSGASPETASTYGAPYEGDLFAAVDAVKTRYDDIVRRCAENPYKMSLVGPRYLEILQRAAEERAA